MAPMRFTFGTNAMIRSTSFSTGVISDVPDTLPPGRSLD